MPDEWGMDEIKRHLYQSVRKLADDIDENPQAIYAALYDKADPMECARNGRAIRVRLADWLAYWERKRTTIEPGSPARAPRRAKAVQP